VSACSTRKKSRPCGWDHQEVASGAPASSVIALGRRLSCFSSNPRRASSAITLSTAASMAAWAGLVRGCGAIHTGVSHTCEDHGHALAGPRFDPMILKLEGVTLVWRLFCELAELTRGGLWDLNHAAEMLGHALGPRPGGLRLCGQPAHTGSVELSRSAQPCCRRRAPPGSQRHAGDREDTAMRSHSCAPRTIRRTCCTDLSWHRTPAGEQAQRCMRFSCCT